MLNLTYEYKLKPTKQHTDRIEYDLKIYRKGSNCVLKERLLLTDSALSRS